MSERNISNVLPFTASDFTAERRSTPETDRLLAASRDRLAHGVATAFAGNLGSANDDLLGMADRATSLEQQQLYFSAMSLLAGRGQELLQQFRSAFVVQFDLGLSALRRGRPREVLDEPGELRLVATDDFERDLTIGKLSARAACNCAQQLTALDRQLACLLRMPRIGQDENPLYPRAVFTAMLRASGNLGASDPLALVLLHAFERQTSVELPGIYNELTRHLADSGILPDIPVGQPRPAPRSDSFGDVAASGRSQAVSPATPAPLGVPLSPTDETAPAAVAWPASQSAPPTAPFGLGPTADDVFAQLAHAIQAASAGYPGRAPLAAPRPVAPSGASIGAAQLIEALTGLQRGRANSPRLPGLGSISIDPCESNVLQQIRSTPLASGSQPVDALTIDIVAMLFDAIFNDPDLPAALRAEIAKLQIPLLKVALIDKAFFSNKMHPARRLLDAIASSGIGRNEADEPRLIDKIRTIVDEVAAGFETDIDIFATELKKLEDFLADEDSRAQSRTGPVVDQLAERDRQELARTRVNAEIDSRIRSRAVPTLVADFLSRYWRLVLARAYVNGGEDGAPWREALGAMNDLLWSVAPKPDSEERSRLLATLPPLLKRLRQGLEASGLSDAWDPFFAELIRLHVGALHRSGDEAEPSVEASTALHGGRRAESLTPRVLPEEIGPAQPMAAAPEVEYRPTGEPRGPAAAEATGDRHLNLAQSLGVGAWVEFQSLRGTRKTLRLSWVSELRGVFLFTNRQGENALTLATASLAEHLRQGRARVLSQDRITDRAVAKVLDSKLREQRLA